MGHGSTWCGSALARCMEASSQWPGVSTTGVRPCHMGVMSTPRVSEASHSATAREHFLFSVGDRKHGLPVLVCLCAKIVPKFIRLHAAWEKHMYLCRDLCIFACMQHGKNTFACMQHGSTWCCSALALSVDTKGYRRPAKPIYQFRFNDLVLSKMHAALTNAQCPCTV